MASENQHVIIASASAEELSFLMEMTKADFKRYLPKARGGDMYAINKMIQYYLEHDDDERVSFWCKRRDQNRTHALNGIGRANPLEK